MDQILEPSVTSYIKETAHTLQNLQKRRKLGLWPEGFDFFLLHGFMMWGAWMIIMIV